MANKWDTGPKSRNTGTGKFPLHHRDPIDRSMTSGSDAHRTIMRLRIGDVGYEGEAHSFLRNRRSLNMPRHSGERRH